MLNQSFKTTVGLAFVIGHFIILIWIFICKFLGGFKFEELTTTIGLVIPLFATYSTSIIRDIVTNSEGTVDSGKRYNKPFRFITLFLSTLFFVYLFAIITIKAFNWGFEDFEQFKLLLGLSETIFGAYIAQILFSMYQRVDAPQQALPTNKTGNP